MQAATELKYEENFVRGRNSDTNICIIIVLRCRNFVFSLQNNV